MFRNKRSRTSDLSDRSEMYLDSKEPKNKQYKILSIVGMISVILVLLLYKIGLFSSGKGTNSDDYIIGTRTQSFEESSNKILSAWGSAGEALRFANLPSTAQGYLTIEAMVQQQDESASKQKIEIFYREASKLNPGGWGIANRLGHQLMFGMKKGYQMIDAINSVKDKGKKKKANEAMDDFVVDKDITLIFLHGRDHASSTWHELGTLNYFAGLGYKVYGIDMPGFGHSQKVRVNSNEWLIDVIVKLLSSQDEEGNVDQDGGEHHTDSHEKNKEAMQHDAAPSTKKIHKIAIISPDISGIYTLDLVEHNWEKLGEKQGLKLVKFIPISMRRTIKPVTAEDVEVEICSIVGENDIDVDNALWEKLENVQTVDVEEAGKHVYVDKPEVVNGIISNFLAKGKCEQEPTKHLKRPVSSEKTSKQAGTQDM